MKNVLLLLSIGLLFSCSMKSSNKKDENTPVTLKEKAITIAKEYANKEIKDATTTVAPNGIIYIHDEQKGYIIDPAETFIGLIDNDSVEDAIVSLNSVYMNERGPKEHLVLLNSNNQLEFVKAIELEIDIQILEDRIITAELHTKPITSPLYDCESCKEIVDYKYENGELVILE